VVTEIELFESPEISVRFPVLWDWMKNEVKKKENLVQETGRSFALWKLLPA
jgi:hypothetical protein